MMVQAVALAVEPILLSGGDAASAGQGTDGGGSAAYFYKSRHSHPSCDGGGIRATGHDNRRPSGDSDLQGWRTRLMMV